MKLKSDKEIFEVHIDLKYLRSKIERNLRQVQKHWNVLEEYNSWLYNILQNFQTYLGTPEVFNLLN